MTTVTAYVSGRHTIYLDEEVEVELDGVKIEDLVKHLESKGYRCIAPIAANLQADGTILEDTAEYKLWEALHFGRDAELKRVASDIVYDRIGRIA